MSCLCNLIFIWTILVKISQVWGIFFPYSLKATESLRHFIYVMMYIL